MRYPSCVREERVNGMAKLGELIEKSGKGINRTFASNVKSRVDRESEQLEALEPLHIQGRFNLWSLDNSSVRRLQVGK